MVRPLPVFVSSSDWFIAPFASDNRDWPEKSTVRGKMVAVHFTTILCESSKVYRHTESHIFAKFVLILTALCVRGLVKFLELFCAFSGFCTLRIMGKCTGRYLFPYGGMVWFYDT